MRAKGPERDVPPGKKKKKEMNTAFFFAVLSAVVSFSEAWVSVCENVLDVPRPANSCPAPFRRGHSLVIADGNAFIFGGNTHAGQREAQARFRSDLWSYSLGAGKWRELRLDWRELSSNWSFPPSPPRPDSPPARSNHVMVRSGMSPSSPLVLAGGQASKDGPAIDDVWEYSPVQNSWRRLATKTGQLSHSAGVVLGGSLYIFGGVNLSSGSYSNELVKIELEPGAVPQKLASFGARIPRPRARHTAVLVGGSRMAIFGGRNASAALNELWELDLRNLTWTNRPAKGYWPSGRFSHAATVCQRSGIAADQEVMVVVGGQDTAHTVFSDVWSFDFGTATWTFPMSDTRKRAEAAIDCVNSKLFVFGGADTLDMGAVFNDMSWAPMIC